MHYERFELEHWLTEKEPACAFALGVSGVAPAPLDLLRPEPGDEDHDYGEIPGEADVVEAAAAFSGAPREEVLLTVGGTEANFLALMTALAPGKRVLVESPTYFPLAEVPRLLGSRVERFERTFDHAFRLDVDALLARIDRTVAAVVLANPNNPTGQIVPEADLKAVAEACTDAGASLIVDEIFRDLTLDAPFRARRLGGNVVTTESLTKCYGLGGLRAGWMLGPPEFVARAREGKALTSISNPRLTQRLTLQALHAKDALLERARGIVAENRRVLDAFFENSDWTWVPSRAPPLGAPRLPEGVDDVKFCEGLLAETGVLLVPGRYVGLPGHVRLCHGLPPDVFREGMRLLGAYAAGAGAA